MGVLIFLLCFWGGAAVVEGVLFLTASNTLEGSIWLLIATVAYGAASIVAAIRISERSRRL